MTPPSLGEIALWTQGHLQGAEAKAQIKGAAIHTAKIVPGELFIALAGAHHDGHDFVEQAIRAGALAAMVEKDVSPWPHLRVGNVRSAFGKWARAYRKSLSRLRVVGITGSSGKTTTKEMLAWILRRVGAVHATPGNLNNDLGVPLVLTGLNRRHRYAVIEMGMNAPGEIAYLARLAQPQVGIITNVGDAHRERFATRRDIAKAKGELLEQLAQDGTAVLNGDDKELVALGRRRRRVIWFGGGKGHAVRILEIANALRFTRVTLGCGQTTRQITLRAVGAHQAYNAAAAVSGAMALGLSFGRACRNLEGFAMASGMRMEWLRLGPHRVLCDAYNANPQSFAAALEYFGSLSRRQPKWVVAGSMFELGKESETMHQTLGRQIRALDPDGVVAVGPASGAILAGLGEDFQGWKEPAEDADAAWRALRKKMDPAGGRVLIKGSRGNRLEKMLDAWRTEIAKASRYPGGPGPSQATRRKRA